VGRTNTISLQINRSGDVTEFVHPTPSRRQGRLESQPLRIAVAENIAFLVRDHVRVDSVTYEQLRSQNTIGPVKTKWETPVLLLGDFKRVSDFLCVRAVGLRSGF
jgi:hypothetical protein